MPILTVINLYLGVPLATSLLIGIGRQVVGFGLTLGLWRVYRRWDEIGPFPIRRGSLAAALVVACTLIDFAILEGLRALFQLGFDGPPPMLFETAYSFGRLVAYGGWTGLYFLVRLYLDRRDRDLKLAQVKLLAREAELQTLRAQLNPHFLFNALNSIIGEADESPERVKKITLSLSEMLHFSLSQREHFAPLGQEIAAIENYLEVESASNGGGLDWKLEIASEAWAQKVPTALLLPLVENAIKYGRPSSPPPLRLRIGAEVRGEVLVAFTENSGEWVDPNRPARRSTGIGLANLRRRLALLCGEWATVEITFPPGCVRVEVEVPLTGAPVTAIPSRV